MHGAAYLQVKKTMPAGKSVVGRDDSRRSLMMQRYHDHQDPKLERWTHNATMLDAGMVAKGE
nr:unnamed protein product [Digitaria exilis]